MADTFGRPDAHDRRGTDPDEEPVLRPGPLAPSSDDGRARVAAGLALLGGVAFVAGIGIAFFSSTLLSTLAYVLVAAPATVVVAGRYLRSVSAGDRSSIVDAGASVASLGGGSSPPLRRADLGVIRWRVRPGAPGDRRQSLGGRKALGQPGRGSLAAVRRRVGRITSLDGSRFRSGRGERL